MNKVIHVNYRKNTDPVFKAFIANVPAELKAKLDECIWEEN